MELYLLELLQHSCFCMTSYVLVGHLQSFAGDAVLQTCVRLQNSPDYPQEIFVNRHCLFGVTCSGCRNREGLAPIYNSVSINRECQSSHRYHMPSIACFGVYSCIKVSPYLISSGIRGQQQMPLQCWNKIISFSLGILCRKAFTYYLFILGLVVMHRSPCLPFPNYNAGTASHQACLHQGTAG